MARPTNLRYGLMIWTFAVLAVVFVASLAFAPAKSYFSEWRATQRQYNTVAAGIGVAPIDPGIQQIWLKELGVVDRCASCHVGMGPGDPIPGDPVFGAHPAIPHEPEEIGCTFCHGGQGRATGHETAHGQAEHWFEPLLERDQFEAGCGSCHSAIPVGRLALADTGRQLFERYDCLACHQVDGRGGGRMETQSMPDLSGVGLRGIPADWYEGHLARRREEADGLLAESFGDLEPTEVEAISEYLGTLVAMPRLARGKRLFHELGCRGCHVVNGVGGSEGPDLSEVGKKSVEELLYPGNFRAERTFASWQVEHLLSPGEVVEGSLMPDQGLTRAQAESLALYLLSLRRAEIPGEYWPPDRTRAERLGEREFGTDGQTLYQVFCAACHGADGSGRAHGVIFGQALPSLVNPDFLAVASDEFLRQVIETGRSGRRMPAWGGGEGGLRNAEVQSLIGRLRSEEPTAPTYDVVAAAPDDPTAGAALYAKSCAVCHGANGEGGIGPSLRSAAFQDLATDRFIHRAITGGRPGTAMGRFRELDAAAIRSLIAHLRSLSERAREPVDLAGVSAFAGDVERGQVVFAASCASCHGAQGEGGIGPGIGKQAFLASAGKAFIALSYSRGRCFDAAGTPPPDVERQGLSDVATWLVERGGRSAVEAAGRIVVGDPRNGQRLYAKTCAACHGTNGEGKEGPALGNPEFLAAANDGFLQATIIRGRGGTAMPGFNRDQVKVPRLSAGEVDDIVSFIRSLLGGEKEEN